MFRRKHEGKAAASAGMHEGSCHSGHVIRFSPFAVLSVLAALAAIPELAGRYCPRPALIRRRFCERSAEALVRWGQAAMNRYFYRAPSGVPCNASTSLGCSDEAKDGTVEVAPLQIPLIHEQPQKNSPSREDCSH